MMSAEKIKYIFLSIGIFTFLVVFSQWIYAKKNIAYPSIQESEQGRILTIPEPLMEALDSEFPGYRIPDETSFDENMMTYFHSHLIGIHPAVAWGDFNQDKKIDFAFLLETGSSPWGPLIELVILNGQKKKGQYESFRIGEVYGYKLDYLRSRDGKLYKGKYKRGGWYINWDPKKKEYTVRKS